MQNWPTGMIRNRDIELLAERIRFICLYVVQDLCQRFLVSRQGDALRTVITRYCHSIEQVCFRFLSGEPDSSHSTKLPTRRFQGLAPKIGYGDGHIDTKGTSGICSGNLTARVADDSRRADAPFPKNIY